VRAVEDYKPLDIEAATMGLALVRGIRKRYPEWEYLLDGDGGDENLKDYPIEENPELTIRSVLNNSMLYQEGWGVHSIKHSLTYSGGLSRSYARTYAPAALNGFDGFSPFTQPEVIRIAESIPFIEWTNWDHAELYELKGRLVSAGIRALTGQEMPVFEKCRFQRGAVESDVFSSAFPTDAMEYRQAFNAIYAS
jgi:asparagine synthase (glutamine-hydrolysing)